ncbi:fasciclin-2 isoform X2 [Pseudomyrmex gracilis]|uniref:fasciclin-2 isoform X2 n=1 Tax=Pseudomyrmex gracilis TaxID=219809 RepID=UPI000994C008|nr:fasciclin-2 isoform X2 [Pseudomyrmex gracilis]
MARHKRPASVTIAVLLLNLAAYVNATDPYLEILPNGETQTKPIGSSIILTCKPKVEDPQLITDMQWLDPQNREIDRLSSHANSKPAMYTELHQDGSLSLFFNSLKEDQAGKYTCKGTYARNVPLVKSVTIDTIIAITWDNAPQNQYPIRGKDYAIQCIVRARPPPSVDWLYNGELIKTNDHYVIDTHSLKIKNVQETDDGVYTCRASVPTTGELQERPIRVEVHVEPSIEEIPSQIDVIEGDSANIECKASGKPPPEFSWVKLFNQQNLSSSDRFKVDPVTGMLAITSVRRDDMGEYQCIASNSAGRVTATIVINVIVKPKISEFVNMTVVQGKNVEMRCKATGHPLPEVTFRKHTAEKPYVMGIQPQDDRIILENKNDETTSEIIGILRIGNVRTDNDGLYECIAKNLGGPVYTNGHLTVEFPPSFRNMPNATAWSWEQRPVNLTCIAESIPNATISWYRGNQNLDIESEGFTKIGNGPVSILQIIPYNQRYYTTYKCVASNTHGKSEHMIELREAKRPGNLLKAEMAETTATTISFDLIPPQQVDLPIKAITVQYKEKNDIWSNAKNKTWSVGSTLYVVENLKPQTGYDFRFAVSTDVGMGNWGNNRYDSTHSRTVPNKPKILTTSDSKYEQSAYSNQYELKWLTPPDNGEPIDLYVIKFCEIIRRVTNDWDVIDKTCKTMETRGRTTQWLKGLKPDTFYTVEVKAHNIMGHSEHGSAMFRTARGVDTSVLQHQGSLMSSVTIIGIVLAMTFIVLIIIDITCCCMRKTGIIYYAYERSRRKPVDEEDSKLGSLYGWRFPLPYCDQKMANVAGVTAIQESGKNTIRLVKHTAIDEKEPLREEKKITPIIDSGLRRETSITFDGKRSVSKTGFVGKDSAV